MHTVARCFSLKERLSQVGLLVHLLFALPIVRASSVCLGPFQSTMLNPCLAPDKVHLSQQLSLSVSSLPVGSVYFSM